MKGRRAARSGFFAPPAVLHHAGFQTMKFRLGRRGIFPVSFEGIDGSGKSTQATVFSLPPWSGRRRVVSCLCESREGLRMGERIRALLLDSASHDHLSEGRGFSSSLPLAPSSSKTVIEPALASGATRHRRSLRRLHDHVPGSRP